MPLKRNAFRCFSLIFVLPFLLDFPSPFSRPNIEKSDSADKEIRALLAKMTSMKSDTFIMRTTSAEQLSIRAADSLLIAEGPRKRAIVAPYYISATEVTNGDWRAFYQAKVLELGEAASKRKFYPDTSLWIKEFRYSYNEPLAKYYFSKPEYANYPVVGITWEQANAYAQWKSKQLKTLLAKAGISNAPVFRLPTEAEWEYAALLKKQDGKHPDVIHYGWSEKNPLAEINQLVNIGQIRDINNMVLKEYADDDCLYTCEVASYPPNSKELYNMIGNVSEWTSDAVSVDTWNLQEKKYKQLFRVEEVDRELALLEQYTEQRDSDYKQTLMKALTHNRKILATKDPKICKGGSWADGIYYTQIGILQGVPKDKASTKIGFRLAISEVKEEVLKYFPKRAWRP